MSTREEIAEQALALPPEDRIYLAELLDRSLGSNGFATPEIAEAWTMEIERRIAKYDRGEVQSNPGHVVIDHIRERLAKRRAIKTQP